MVRKKQITDFVQNNFESATISLVQLDGQIDLKLNLNQKENTKNSFEQLVIQELGKDAKVLFNYLLDAFLENNNVLMVRYYFKYRKCFDKNCFELRTEDKRLVLLFPCDFAIDSICPLFISKIEKAKQKGIFAYLKELEYKITTKSENRLDLYLNKVNETSFSASTGIITGTIGLPIKRKNNYFYYNVLKVPSNGKEVVPDLEKEFVYELLKNILSFSDIDILFEFILPEIDKLINYIESGIHAKGELKLGNLFLRYDTFDENEKEKLELLKELVLMLKRDFETEIDSKQLRIGGIK